MSGTSAAQLARRNALAAPLVLGGIAASGVLALRLRDPHTSGSWGFCPLQRLTGVFCPGCGGLRAVNDLTHLDLAVAVSSNLLVVALMPVAVVLWGRWLLRLGHGVGRSPGSASRQSQRLVLLAVAVAAVAFTVVRNLPAGAWLAP